LKEEDLVVAAFLTKNQNATKGERKNSR